MTLFCNKCRMIAVIADHGAHFGHHDIIITDSQSINTPFPLLAQQVLWTKHAVERELQIMWFS